MLGLRQPICKEFRPVKIRVHRTLYNADNKAVVVVEKEDAVHSVFRTPVRLHEQFKHRFSYIVELSERPGSTA